MRSTTALYLTFIISTLLLISGCRSKGGGVSEAITVDIDSTNIIVKYDGSLFPVPSTWEATRLLKSINLPYDVDLTASGGVERYSTSFKQALNLGVLSSDISYLNLYGQVQQSVVHLSWIKILCSQLGLDQIFNERIYSLIEQNLSQPDSLANVMSSTYALSDTYLKTNNRHDIGALIITGAWVESMYVLTQSALRSQNRDIINRIGEQKVPLHNLIELLTPYYYKSSQFTTLIDAIVDLNNDFDAIIYSYTYKPPTVKPAQKLIIINSQSRIVISDYHLQTISKKVKTLRNSILE